MSPMHRQRGVTFLGWLFLLVPVAIIVYAGIRVTPFYLNYMSVARSLDQAASSLQADGSVSVRSIRSSIGKRFDIEGIEFPDVKDVTISRDGSSWVIEAKYEDVAPLFSNVSILLDFDKVAKIGG